MSDPEDSPAMEPMHEQPLAMEKASPQEESPPARKKRQRTPAQTPRASQPSPETKTPPAENLSDPSLYLNRELTWLEFNRRVLHEAQDERTPLLERIKFISIVSSNLDEFFMKRIGGLKQQLGAGIRRLTVDGRTPKQQIEECHVIVRDIEARKRDLLPKLLELLRTKGISLLPYSDLTAKEKKQMREYYFRNIFPLITPQSIDPAHPFPFISNLSLNLLVTLRYARDKEVSLARVKVPMGAGINRFLRVGKDDRFVAIEDVICQNLDMLFPGMRVISAACFRVTRNSNTEKNEEQADDLLAMIESELQDRKFAPIVRMEVMKGMEAPHRGMLAAELDLDETADVFEVDGMMAMRDLMQIATLEYPELRDPPHAPIDHPALQSQRNIFHIIRDAGSILLHHPYESFSTSVERFLQEASEDPKVRAIKMTLYRTARESRIIDCLINAAQNGKQVAVAVELKARFDEENNIGWARALESEGVHVVYGVVGLKTHAKICLVVRRERGGIRRYVHMGTGNYNAVTANVYGDLSLFTADPEIGSDASDLFNALTGYAHSPSYRRLIVAPGDMRRALLERIDREIRLHRERGDGRIVFKMNALVDRECIEALYRASRAGVRVDLQIRGICCLRPGVPGLSENVRVSQIVGRFLEHARIYAFRNGGEEEVLVGSADLMPRNLDRRVELLFPVLDPGIREMILRTLLPVWLQDTAKASLLQPDGSYRRIRSDAKEGALRDAQAWFLEHRGAWGLPG